MCVHLLRAQPLLFAVQMKWTNEKRKKLIKCFLFIRQQIGFLSAFSPPALSINRFELTNNNTSDSHIISFLREKKKKRKKSAIVTVTIQRKISIR